MDRTGAALRPHRPGSLFRGIAITLFVLWVVSLTYASPVRSGPPEDTVATEATIYMPLTTQLGLRPPIELDAAWTIDAAGTKIFAFHKGDPIQYAIQINNVKTEPKEVDLVWMQSRPAPCGDILLFSETVTFEPGVGVYTHDGTVPNCFGVYTNTIQATHLGDTYTITFQYAVPTPSEVVIGEKQGFDKCSLPTVQQMQTWWDESPYYTMNLYIGGNSLACDDPKLNPAWIYQVNQQGWTFILTWVGPQAPCTGFKKIMDPDPEIAREEGRANAEAAAEAAWRLGFFDDHVIYYDLEAYGGNQASDECRDAVSSFIEGWVLRIHELGFKAGAYGGCGSNIIDWAEISQPPDNVWIAFWNNIYKYDPNETVWDVPCLSDSLWANHQRLKQYTGGHLETWGGLSFTIDSDVIDGQVNDFLPATVLQDGDPGGQQEAIPVEFEPQIQDFGLLSPGHGWTQLGGRLLKTRDGGASWQDITPEGGETGEVLGVTFQDINLGWLVRRSAGGGGQAGLSILQTSDGGERWDSAPLPLLPEEVLSIAAAHPHFIDENTGWVALQVQSGSNFSLGRLFATQDGGNSWEERSLPLGEPVRFVDPLRGFVAGGPAGDLLYQTRDGGLSWETQSLPDLGEFNFESIFVGLPDFENEQEGWLPLTLAGQESALVVLRTTDGGGTWSLDTKLDLDTAIQPGEALPFSLAGDGYWRAAVSGTVSLYASALEREVVSPAMNGLSGYIVDLNFGSDASGWALVQDGTCAGNKLRADELTSARSDPLSCTQQARLIATEDGGLTWFEVRLPD